MFKLETLIKLNNLEKLNRKNRLEDMLRQKECYGEIEDLFEHLTKTLNENNEAWQAQGEAMQALQNRTLVALRGNTNVLNRVDFQRQRQRQSSFLEQTNFVSPVKLKYDRGKTFAVDNEMFEILF